jgi:hypothetical protein
LDDDFSTVAAAAAAKASDELILDVPPSCLFCLFFKEENE